MKAVPQRPTQFGNIPHRDQLSKVVSNKGISSVREHSALIREHSTLELA